MKSHLLPLLCGTLFLAMSIPGQACTGVMLTTQDGSVVHGRTLEFGQGFDFSVVSIPHDYRFVGKTPMGEGLAYHTKYAALGVFSSPDAIFVDGLNEKGLAVGTFYFPNTAEYTPVTKENQSKGLSPADFPSWVLTQFATTEEVKKAIESETVVVTPTLIKGWGPTSPGFHYLVYDKAGKSIVIEPTGGKLVVYDNPIGVLTNAPTFDWHMTNLRNYIALDPQDAPAVELAGMILKPVGQGNGMLGLPGDFSPPSRFIRATIFSATALPVKNSQEGIFQVFHVLNNFDIPLGVVREKTGNTTDYDHTIFTAARDPRNLTYYYKTYDDQTVRKINLKGLDLDAKELKTLSMKGKQVIVDMTKEL